MTFVDLREECVGGLQSRYTVVSLAQYRMLDNGHEKARRLRNQLRYPTQG